MKDLLDNHYLKPVKPVGPVEEYTIKDLVSIIISRRKTRLEYIVVEPPIDDRIIDTVIELYMANPSCKTSYCIGKTLQEKNISEKARETYINNPVSVTYHYLKLQSGYGPLYPLVIDPYIEEISGNSVDKVVEIIHRKYTWYGWMNTNIVLEPRLVDRIVLGLARRAGKHLSLAYPIAEGLTSEGLRISLTYGWEVSRKGSSFTIRKKPPRIKTITELIDQGVLDTVTAAYLWLILELKGFIIITGGMSTGKTTLLQALLTLIPPTKRIVTIEDTPEITGTTGIWDPLVERVSIRRNQLNIDMYTLLKFSLRRRADYIVVGEVRGREARLLVQASRLGHGVLATMHGESAESVIERLSAPPISIPRNLLTNIWSIVVMEYSSGRRVISRIYEVDKHLRISEVYKYGHGTTSSRVLERIVSNTTRLKYILDEEVIISEISSRASFLQQLVNRGIFSIDVLSDEIGKYYYSELLVEKEVREAIK